jgi:hypothetical protein
MVSRLIWWADAPPEAGSLMFGRHAPAGEPLRSRRRNAAMLATWPALFNGERGGTCVFQSPNHSLSSGCKLWPELSFGDDDRRRARRESTGRPGLFWLSIVQYVLAPLHCTATPRSIWDLTRFAPGAAASEYSWPGPELRKSSRRLCLQQRIFRHSLW